MPAYTSTRAVSPGYIYTVTASSEAIVRDVETDKLLCKANEGSQGMFVAIGGTVSMTTEDITATITQSSTTSGGARFEVQPTRPATGEEGVIYLIPITSSTDEDNEYEEWIWVKGYKGTDKDMKCRDYQYELHKCFDISDDKEVVECEHGFHLCKDRIDVFKYYPIRDSNRFFEVKALVRKTDYESYNGGNFTYDINNHVLVCGKDKLVAKSIIFTRELTVDEILSDIYVPDNWSAEDKKTILELGYEEAFRFVGRRELNKLGYSDTFSEIIIKDGKFDIARAVGTQEGLSMDMKVWTIYNHQGQSKHR